MNSPITLARIVDDELAFLVAYSSAAERMLQAESSLRPGQLGHSASASDDDFPYLAARIASFSFFIRASVVAMTVTVGETGIARRLSRGNISSHRMLKKNMESLEKYRPEIKNKLAWRQFGELVYLRNILLHAGLNIVSDNDWNGLSSDLKGPELCQRKNNGEITLGTCLSHSALARVRGLMMLVREDSVWGE